MASYAERLELVWHEGAGLSAWAGTVDHKRIGLRYLYTGFVFFVLAGLEATLMRVQLAAPGLETRRALEISGLDRHFTVHETVEQALSASD